MLAKATAAFGDVPVRRLLPDEIGRWSKRLPEGHRHDAMVALRQVLNAAVRWKVIEENSAKLVPNPLPRPPATSDFDGRPDAPRERKERDAGRKTHAYVGVPAVIDAALGLDSGRPYSRLRLARPEVLEVHVAASHGRKEQGGVHIDRAYGHLAPDAEAYERGLLDAYDAKGETTGRTDLGKQVPR